MIVSMTGYLWAMGFTAAIAITCYTMFFVGYISAVKDLQADHEFMMDITSKRVF